MHRILMYADATESGLKKMELDILESMSDDYDEDGVAILPNEVIELDMAWVSWQLEDERFTTKEDAWKIMYFLINSKKIKLIKNDIIN